MVNGVAALYGIVNVMINETLIRQAHPGGAKTIAFAGKRLHLAAYGWIDISLVFIDRDLYQQQL